MRDTEGKARPGREAAAAAADFAAERPQLYCWGRTVCVPAMLFDRQARQAQFGGGRAGGGGEIGGTGARKGAKQARRR